MRVDNLRLPLALLADCIVLPGCSDSDDVTIADFKLACESTTNMGAEICQCLGENAAQDLSPDGFAFLTAMMQKDTEKLTALREQMEFADLTAASMYMVSGPANCAATQ